jgi:pimeloyl-ACP methyl ester carboxylesterase
MPSLRLPEVELHYAESGPPDGPPLLLIHGMLGDQRSFAAQMAPLGAAGHRVMAVSLRHCWPDSWREGGDFTIDTHVADLAGFIRALGRGPVALMGHSRGGHIAFRLAERHPELVRALILAEPGGELDESLGGQKAAATQAGAFAKAARLIAAGDEEGGLRSVFDHIGGPGAWEKRPEARKAINRANARTLLGQIHERRSPYSRAAAAAIRAPTPLLHGANTQPGYIANVEALAGAMPQTRIVVIPNATHGLTAENPAAVNQAVIDFLAGL